MNYGLINNCLEMAVYLHQKKRTNKMTCKIEGHGDMSESYEDFYICDQCGAVYYGKIESWVFTNDACDKYGINTSGDKSVLKKVPGKPKLQDRPWIEYLTSTDRRFIKKTN